MDTQTDTHRHRHRNNCSTWTTKVGGEKCENGVDCYVTSYTLD